MRGKMNVIDYISEELINLDLKAKNKEEVLDELAQLISSSENISNAEDVRRALAEREKIGSTGIGRGVAIPHAKTEGAEKLTIAYGYSKEKIDYNSLDGEKVNMFFTFASPMKDSQIYLKILARISRFLREENFREKISKCQTPKEVMDCIREIEGV
ncbi:MAG: PTS sugar transporter subunit IIA [Fusobacteriaceae bacterium]